MIVRTHDCDELETYQILKIHEALTRMYNGNHPVHISGGGMVRGATARGTTAIKYRNQIPENKKMYVKQYITNKNKYIELLSFICLSLNLKNI